MKVPSPVVDSIVKRLSVRYDQQQVADIITTVTECFTEFDVDKVLDTYSAAQDIETVGKLSTFREARSNITSICRAYNATFLSYVDVPEEELAVHHAKKALGYIFVTIGKPLSKNQIYMYIGYTTGGDGDNHIQMASNEFIRKHGCASARVAVVCEVKAGSSYADSVVDAVKDIVRETDGLMYRSSKQCFVCTHPNAAHIVLGKVLNTCGYSSSGDYHVTGEAGK